MERTTNISLINLLNDQKTRSLILQTVTLILVLLLVFLIIQNITVNLASVGKEFSFGFLNYPAGYDITFQPFIEYSPTDTHMWAGLVGLLNTLLVAVTGIILATIFGFILGICRLSSNFLVNKLSYLFVEFTRNVPVLLHIIIIHSIIIHSLPVPKKALSIGDAVHLTNRGFFIPKPTFQDGFNYVIVALIVSIILAVIYRIWAKQVQTKTGKIYPVFSVGLIIIFGITGITFFASGAPVGLEIPSLRGFNFRGGLAVRPEYIALWFALSYYTSAFIAEIVRGGILAIHKGQTEAAYAIGLTPKRTLQLVIIPQAMRIIIPPLASQYLNLTKNSSLAIAIGYMDIVATLGGISLMQTGKEMETMIIVLLVYLLCSLFISLLMNIYNRSIRIKDR